MRRKSPPSLDFLRKYFGYNKLTGAFTHKRNVGCAKIGSIAGAARPDGYVHIFVKGESYLAHHLAWYYIYGIWPTQLDHRNRIRSDNRIKNLRLSTSSQNSGNSLGWAPSKRSHKLPRGVYKNGTNRFRAIITIGGNMTHLGYYPTVAEAKQAYTNAAKKHFGKFATQ